LRLMSTTAPSTGCWRTNSTPASTRPTVPATSQPHLTTMSHTRAAVSWLSSTTRIFGLEGESVYDIRPPCPQRHDRPPRTASQAFGLPRRVRRTSRLTALQGMYDPPFTCSTCPVTALASLEARKTAVEAI